MAHAFVIETLYFTAGIVALQDSGFPLLRLASRDGPRSREKIFRSPKAAQTAAEKIGGGYRNRTGSPAGLGPTPPPLIA